MPKKIPLVEMRKWLSQYEEGKSVATIAKQVKHDVRTVAHGIEQARHETEARAAHGKMLMDALQKHQNDLAEVIESLRSAIVVPPANIALPTEESTARRISLNGSVAEPGDNGWTVILAVEGTMKWELFQEHMRRDLIWKILSEWKTAVASYLKASVDLGQKVASLLREATNLEIVELITKATGDRYLYPVGVQAIYAHVVNSSLGIPGQASAGKELRVEEPYLHYGRDRLPILIAPGAVEEYKTRVLKVFAELQKPGVTYEVISSYRKVEEVTQKASKAVEEISLLRLVPGQCRVCRRLLGA